MTGLTAAESRATPCAGLVPVGRAWPGPVK
jgi:hypothetical protein